MDYKKQDMVNMIDVSKIITIHYFEFDKDFSFCGESHDFWEIVYADKGEVIVTAQEREFTLKQGELVFHKPGEFHNLRADGITAPNIFIVSFVCESEIMRSFEQFKAKATETIKKCISRILFEGQKTFDILHTNPYMREMLQKPDAPIWSQQFVKLSIEELLLELLRCYILREPSHSVMDKKCNGNREVFSIISFMKRHIDENLTVEDFCRLVNYGKTYVSAVFSEQSGYTLMQYFTKLKIEKAKSLLRETGKSAAEISAELSYSPQYFYRIFKKTTGMTVKEYRKSLPAYHIFYNEYRAI